MNFLVIIKKSMATMLVPINISGKNIPSKAVRVLAVEKEYAIVSVLSPVVNDVI
jgi:hypothetical protein